MNPFRLVRFLEGLHAWLAACREFNHKDWLRRNGVVHTYQPNSGMPRAHHSTRRNGTEAVTR